MRFGIVVFPGTWSDTDCYYVVSDILGQQADYVWHQETDLSLYDCLVLPGGFSYGLVRTDDRKDPRRISTGESLQFSARQVPGGQ